MDTRQNARMTHSNDTMNPNETMQSCPALPLEVAEAVLVAAIRSIRYIRRSDSAKQAPYLNVALRSIIPEVTKAAVARQVWVDMDHASACGDVDLLNLMVRMRRQAEYSESVQLHYTANAVDVASERGYLQVLQWWVAQRDWLPVKYTDAAMDRASETGRVDVLEWWESESGLSLRFSCEAIRKAANEGHVHVLDWWARHGRFDARAVGQLTGFADCVGATGRLDVLDWLLANSNVVVRDWTQYPYSPNMARDAFENGNVQVLDWMLEHGLRSLVGKFDSDSIHAVIGKDARNSLEWLAQGKVNIPPNDGIEWAICRKKDKELAQWLLDVGVSQVSFELFIRAFGCGDADYVEWCYERLDVSLRGRVMENIVLMFLKASSAGSVDTLNWIVARLGCSPVLFRGKNLAPMYAAGLKCTSIEDSFMCASQNGHVAVFDWFVENGFPSLSMSISVACTFLATETGNWHVLEWLSCDPLRSSLIDSSIGSVLAGKLVNHALRGFDVQKGSDYVRVLEWIRQKYRSAFHSGQFNSEAAFSQSVALLDWWASVFEQSPLQRSVQSRLISLDSITNAGVLKWWLSSGRSDFEYSAVAIDRASASGNVDLLNCWRQFALAHDAATEKISQRDAGDHPLLKYTSAAMDNASRNGHLEVLEWWESSGIVPLKYSKHQALRFTSLVPEEKREEIVRWWLSSDLP